MTAPALAKPDVIPSEPGELTASFPWTDYRAKYVTHYGGCDVKPKPRHVWPGACWSARSDMGRLYKRHATGNWYGDYTVTS